MYSHPVFDPYLSHHMYYDSTIGRSGRIYESNELPYWLAIGPIYWEASYNAKHWYVKSMLDKGYINFGKDEVSG